MSEFVIIGENTAATEDVQISGVITDENIIDGGETGNNTEETTTTDEITDTGETDTLTGEEAAEGSSNDGMEDAVISEPITEEGEYGIPAYDEGYVDTGLIEGGMVYPGMETGTSEVKDPLLSSWPFVIGISAAVLIVSIALWAFLARLKIKKGIDLYED